jgi:hypothetical protein
VSDEALIGIFLIGLVLGPAIGGLVGWRFGMMAGAGAGSLLIGACGTAAAIGFGWKGWQIVHGALPADPDHPTWGGAIAFSIFGLLPLAFGLFFVGQAVAEARPRRHAAAEPPPISATRERIGRNLTVAGNLMVLIGIASGYFIEEQNNARGFGRTFAAIGIAIAVHGVAFIVRRAGDWQQPAVCFIVALGFVLFGTLAWVAG